MGTKGAQDRRLKREFTRTERAARPPPMGGGGPAQARSPPSGARPTLRMWRREPAVSGNRVVGRAAGAAATAAVAGEEPAPVRPTREALGAGRVTGWGSGRGWGRLLLGCCAGEVASGCALRPCGSWEGEGC